MYCPLTLNGYSNFINAVKRQRNLGLADCRLEPLYNMYNVYQFNYLSLQIWYCILFSLIFHSSDHCKAKKKNVCLWSHVKKIQVRSALIFYFFYYWQNRKQLFPVPESDSGISFSKFPVSRHLLKLFYDENTQFFYLLCSQFRQKASG